MSGSGGSRLGSSTMCGRMVGGTWRGKGEGGCSCRVCFRDEVQDLSEGCAVAEKERGGRKGHHGGGQTRLKQRSAYIVYVCYVPQKLCTCDTSCVRVLRVTRAVYV